MRNLAQRVNSWKICRENLLEHQGNGKSVKKGLRNGTENRRHERIQVRGDIFAAFIRPNEPVRVGRVVDFSSGGLGVQYVTTSLVGEGPVKVEIFSSGPVRTERIESKVVYDREILSESSLDICLRHCGVEFKQPCSLVQSQLLDV